VSRRIDRAAPEYDLVIAGAGPVGCVIAERAATELGWSVLIVERRDHVAGNCHDAPNADGILLHHYGPHYFRTNSDQLLAYLSRFTAWLPGDYVVKASVGGKLVPFPINLTTLEQIFGRPLDEASARALLEEKREPFDAPANSEELVLSRVGRELYEAFYLNYSIKQWGRSPRELAPSVCGRIPVRLNREEQYVDARHRVMPAGGYTAMFEAMIAHPSIDVILGADFFEVRRTTRARRATVYTGPIDRYFDYVHGALPWRSLEFEHRTVDRELAQPCVQINYPNEHAYTRTVEIKHVTKQQHPRTVVTYEYPRAEGDPYYPIPAPDHDARYQRYRELAVEETAAAAVYFVGRLAEYTYINTDQAVERALDAFTTIAERFGG
jgi:UDP-galactopyranose mutase